MQESESGPSRQAAFFWPTVANGAAGLAAFAGGLGAPIFAVHPDMGSGILLDLFLAVILGGLGNLPGTAMGALFVALAKSIGGGYVAEWSTASSVCACSPRSNLSSNRPFRPWESSLKSPRVSSYQQRGWQQLAPPLALLALLAVLPLIAISTFTVTLLTEAMIFAIWAMSLDLLIGYTGLISFAMRPRLA